MAVINKTNSAKLVNQAKICSSQLSQARGLMFAKPLQDQCLVFVFSSPRKVTLHMMFVFFPIDILYLDSEKKVVEIKENVKPFTPLIVPSQAAKYILELPSSTIRKTKTKINHVIDFGEIKKNI